MDHRLPEDKSSELQALSDSALARHLEDANRRLSPPPDLVDRIARAIERDQRSLGDRWGMRWAAALAAAAVFLLALLGWVVTIPRSQTPPHAPPPPMMLTSESPVDHVGEAPLASPASPGSRPDVEVNFPDASGLFAREIDTGSPNVTLLMVYRTSAPAGGSSPSNGG